MVKQSRARTRPKVLKLYRQLLKESKKLGLLLDPEASKLHFNDIKQKFKS